MTELAGGNQALVRVDKITQANTDGSDSSSQKVSRGKAYNEFRAYEQFANESADIVRN